MKPYSCNCGDKPRIITHEETLYEPEYIEIRCEDCFEMRVTGDSTPEAVDRWNRLIRRTAER